jgi:hypothetical protein
MTLYAPPRALGIYTGPGLLPSFSLFLTLVQDFFLKRFLIFTGHSCIEPGIISELVKATDKFKTVGL